MPLPGFFISQIGQQPASVAITLFNMANAGLVKEAFFLSTLKTQPIAENLLSWFMQTNPEMKVTIVPQNNYKNAETLAAALKTYADTAPQDPIYVNLAGGMSFFWAKVSRLVCGLDNIYPVFSERDSLVCLRSENTWELSGLGLEPLLKLYHLQGHWQNTDKPGLVRNLVIMSAGTGQTVACFDHAYERNGYLHVLRENIDTLAQARDVIDIHHKATGFNGLKPVILATTQNPNVSRRLQQAGCDVVLFTKKSADEAKRGLEQWFAGQPETPGRALPLFAQNSSLPPTKAQSGAGGDGDPLLVCLGNDPSSTLSAICSHRPRLAYVLYDVTTPRIVFMAKNLAQVSARLPVDEISFVSVGPGHLGKGIDSRNLSDLLKTPNLCANISPGSKVQAWALGQLENIPLFSLKVNPEAQVTPLFTESSIKEWDIIPGSPELIGQIVGGQGAEPRLTAENLWCRRELLSGIACCIERGSDSKGNFLFFKPKKELNRTFGNISLQTRWQNDLIYAALKKNGQAVSGTFSAPMEKGMIKADWLEDVTGGAFLEVGGKNLLVGMTWPWGKRLDGRKHRTEIDVVFTWRHVHVVVSVKACPLSPQKIEEKCLEVRAMVSECFGRFALPVLVYYAPRGRDIELKSRNFMQDSKVLLVPAGLLTNTARLKELLDEGLKGQSTTRRQS